VSRLPLKPSAVTLTGPTITLLPMKPEMFTARLHDLTNGSAIESLGRSVPAYDPDEFVWRYLFGGPFESADGLCAYLADQTDAPDRRCLAIWHNVADQPVGVFNLASNSPANLRIELGGIALSPIMQGTGVLAECTYLALAHCFDLGYHRVEWKCDNRNERSKRAALRLGFTAEGVQDQHMIVKGQRRDTAWFRMLADEWPRISRARTSDN
jgi:RimJ/RimL family protein N-acetyltransferase